MNINKVMLCGNITRDPEIRQLPSGMNVANIGVATNRYYTNQQGERVEEVEFHNVVLFGRLAELVQQYLSKGRSVFIEGRLRTSSWEAEGGVKKYKTEIIAEQMQFGPRREGDAQPQQQPPQVQPKASEEKKTPNYPEATINPDDIPF